LQRIKHLRLEVLLWAVQSEQPLEGAKHHPGASSTKLPYVRALHKLYRTQTGQVLVTANDLDKPPLRQTVKDFALWPQLNLNFMDGRSLTKSNEPIIDAVQHRRDFRVECLRRRVGSPAGEGGSIVKSVAHTFSFTFQQGTTAD
jgi:glutaredoxin-related protein